MSARDSLEADRRLLVTARVSIPVYVAFDDLESPGTAIEDAVIEALAETGADFVTVERWAFDD